MDWVAAIREQVVCVISQEQQCVAHRMDHVERVLTNAKAIAAHYPEVDTEVLQLAVLLHDVCHPVAEKKNHVQLSIQRARELLTSIQYPQGRIKKVLSIIQEHSTEHIHSIQPSTIEAQILFDADKLDGVGASGIARVFAMHGQLGRVPSEAIEWYRQKIEKALPNMQTPEGRRLVQSRLEFVNQFLNALQQDENSHHVKHT